MFNTGEPASGAHRLIFDHEMNPGTAIGRLWQMIASVNCNDYRLPIMKSYSHKWLNYPELLLNSCGTQGRVVSRTHSDRDGWSSTQSNVTRALWESAPRTNLVSYAAQIKSIQGRDAHLYGLIRTGLSMSNLVVRNINPVFPKSESGWIAVLLHLESFLANNLYKGWSAWLLMGVL